MLIFLIVWIEFPEACLGFSFSGGPGYLLPGRAQRAGSDDLLGKRAERFLSPSATRTTSSPGHP
jgi:hypothetical protein